MGGVIPVKIKSGSIVRSADFSRQQGSQTVVYLCHVLRVVVKRMGKRLSVVMVEEYVGNGLVERFCHAANLGECVATSTVS